MAIFCNAAHQQVTYLNLNPFQYKNIYVSDTYDHVTMIGAVYDGHVSSDCFGVFKDLSRMTKPGKQYTPKPKHMHSSLLMQNIKFIYIYVYLIEFILF